MKNILLAAVLILAGCSTYPNPGGIGYKLPATASPDRRAAYDAMAKVPWEQRPWPYGPRLGW